MEDVVTFWKILLGSRGPIEDNKLLIKCSEKVLSAEGIRGIMSRPDPSHSLCYYLIDSLRRRQSFQTIIDLFREAFEDDLFGALSAKDLLISLLQSIPEKHHAYIFWLYAQVRGPLPVFYQIFKVGVKGPELKSFFSINSLRDVLGFKMHSVLVNIGPSDSCGKSTLLEKIIFGNMPIPGLLNSKGEGYSHRNSVDVVVGDETRWTMVDVHGWPDQEQEGSERNEAAMHFQQAIMAFLDVASAVILHITASQKDQLKSSFDQLAMRNDPGSQSVFSRGKVIVCIRDCTPNALQGLQGKIGQIAEDLNLDPANVLPMPNLSNEREMAKIVKKIHGLLTGLPNQQNQIGFPGLVRPLVCERPRTYTFEGLTGAGFVVSDAEDRLAAEDCKLQAAQLRGAMSEIALIMERRNDLKRTLRPKRHSSVDQFEALVTKQDIEGIKEFASQLGAWKEPKTGPLRAERLALMVQLTDRPGDNQTKNRLESVNRQLDDLDISVDTYWRELICSSSRFGKNLIACYAQWVQDGNPVQILEGKYLQMPGDFLGHVFGDELFPSLQRPRKLFVVSVIGGQSSAKSTLLNYLFGCGFATSAGRCTKGLYASVMENPDLDLTLVVLDSEGLMSVEARDSVFDKQLTLMAMACAHVVIVNYKGEINKPIQELLEVCLFGLSSLKIAELSPRMLFVQRDMANTDEATQKKQILNVRGALEIGAETLNIRLKDYLNLDEDSVVMMAPAFNSGKTGEIKWSCPNNLFSDDCSVLRNNIFKWAHEVKLTTGFRSLKSWVTHAQSVWKTIQMFGPDMLNFNTIREIQEMDQLNKMLHEMWGMFADDFNKKSEEMIEEVLKSSSIDETKLLERLENLKATTQKDLIAAFETKAKDISVVLFPRCVGTLEDRLDHAYREKRSRWNIAIEKFNAESAERRSNSQLLHKVRELMGSGKRIDQEELVEQLLPERKKALQKLHSKLEESPEEITTSVHMRFNALIKKDPMSFGWVKMTPAQNAPDPSILQICQYLVDEANQFSFRGAVGSFFWGDRSAAATRLSNGIREFLDKFLDKFLDTKNLEKIKDEELADVVYQVREFWVCVWKKEAELLSNASVVIKEKMSFGAFHYEVRQRVILAELKKCDLRREKHEKELTQLTDDFTKLVQHMVDNQRSDAGRATLCGAMIIAQLVSVASREATSFLEGVLSPSYIEMHFSTEEYHKRAFVDGFGSGNANGIVAYLKDVLGVMQEQFNKDYANQMATWKISGKAAITKKVQDLIQELVDATVGWAKKEAETGEVAAKVEIERAELVQEANPMHTNEWLQCLQRTTNYGKELPFLQELKYANILIVNRVTFQIALVKELKGYASKVPEVAEEKLRCAITVKRQGIWNSIRGCPARCPLCSQKCNLPNDSHQTHSACHVIMAFCGVRDHHRKTPELRLCTDQSAQRGGWYYGDKAFSNVDEMLRYRGEQSWLPLPIENTGVTSELRLAWMKTRTEVIKLMNYDITDDNTLIQQPEWGNLVRLQT